MTELQAAGFRTFAMVCPILPQADPVDFARQALRRLQVDQCEHVWAEPVNARTKRSETAKENSLMDTLRALRIAAAQGHPDAYVADRFERVVNDKAAWNLYCRETFNAFAQETPPGKLRWMQYPPTDVEVQWWLEQGNRGALVLGPQASKFLKRQVTKGQVELKAGTI